MHLIDILYSKKIPYRYFFSFILYLLQTKKAIAFNVLLYHDRKERKKKKNISELPDLNWGPIGYYDYTITAYRSTS